MPNYEIKASGVGHRLILTDGDKTASILTTRDKDEIESMATDLIERHNLKDKLDE